MRSYGVASLVCVLVSLPASAQSRTLTLSNLAVVPGEFIRVSGAIELPSGSVVVLDNGAGSVYSVTGKSSRQAGRNGRGPNEYLSPTRVWAWQGDSVALHDEGNWRFLIVDPNTFRGRTVSLPTATARQVKGADRAGGLYYQGSDLLGVESDSTPMIRLNGAGVDTIGMVRLPKRRALSEIGGVPVDGVEGALSIFQPFAPGDDWCVGPDGAIAIVRAEPFRVEWFIPGKGWLKGKAIPYEPIPVTAKDREDLRVTAAGTTLTVPGASGRRVIRPTQTPDLPRTKPAFVRSSAVMDPRGRVWIRASQPAGDSAHLYMVIDREARLMESIRLPSNARLVGFGPKRVILAIADEDEIESVFLAPLPLP